MRSNQVVFALALASVGIAAHADDSWTPYVGIGGGVQYLDQNTSINGTVPEYVGQQRDYPVYFYNHHSGGVLNAYAGLGRFTNKVYTAFEFDIYYNPANYTSSTAVTYAPFSQIHNTQTMTASMPWRFGFSGIMGYQATQKWLPYARLGAEIGHLQTGYNSVSSDPNDPIPTFVQQNFSQNLLGGTIGIGSRYYLAPHFFVAIEGDYTRYLNANDQKASMTILNNGQIFYHSQPYNYQFQTSIYSLIASMGYQF